MTKQGTSAPDDFELGPDDCALIFRADGRFEAEVRGLPGLPDGKLPEHVLLMSSVLCQLKSDESFKQRVLAWLETQSVN
jgi:hypothetical protein